MYIISTSSIYLLCLEFMRSGELLRSLIFTIDSSKLLRVPDATRCCYWWTWHTIADVCGFVATLTLACARWGPLWTWWRFPSHLRRHEGWAWTSWDSKVCSWWFDVHTRGYSGYLKHWHSALLWLRVWSWKSSWMWGRWWESWVLTLLQVASVRQLFRNSDDWECDMRHFFRESHVMKRLLKDSIPWCLEARGGRIQRVFHGRDQFLSECIKIDTRCTVFRLPAIPSISYISEMSGLLVDIGVIRSPTMEHSSQPCSA